MFENKIFRKILSNLKRLEHLSFFVSYSAGPGFCSCLGNVLSLVVISINCLTPNDPYMGLTAPLTSKRCILYIYSTNIGTEYFKHALYSPFFLFKMQFVS